MSADYSQLAARALPYLLRDTTPTCGIHGELIVDRRCRSCDAAAAESVTPPPYDLTNADQANPTKESNP